MLKSAELMSLLEDFYTLTGIRIVLFDENYCEECSFPSGEDTLCSCLRKSPEFDQKCRECDVHFFNEGKRKEGVLIYRCHAGLTEASVPILRSGSIVGYLMFGQITVEKDKSVLTQQIYEICRICGITDIPKAKIRHVKYKSDREIRAAAKILEAVSEYVIMKDMIRASKPIIQRIMKYIDDHLGEELTIDTLCREFDISRTGLYQALKPYSQEGVSHIIKKKRLRRAKELIETTQDSICDIAERVGFSGDYNYFLRCFKAEFGHSSNYYRKK